MSHPSPLTSATDPELIHSIRSAKRRLIFIAPGLSQQVARALIGKWAELGPGAVEVILDPDPEVCRLGYGEQEAIERLHQEATRLGARIYEIRGLRIGICISDESVLVYSPVPLLIEAGTHQEPKPNGIRLDGRAVDPAHGFGPAHLTAPSLGAQPVGDSQLQRLRDDLKANPPLKFDVARRVRVFNAIFEFVEFELRGLAISRKSVKIPADLLGLANRPDLQRRLNSSFQLVGKRQRAIRRTSV